MNLRSFPAILVFCCAATAALLLTYSRSLPVLDEMARAKVFDEERAALRATLLEAHPDLSTSTSQQLLETSWKFYQKEHRADLRSKAEEKARELKEPYRDERGDVYMGGIDSYHWLRHLKNLYVFGHVGDRIEKGVEYDVLGSRPVDASTRHNVHLYLALPLVWLAGRLHLPLGPVLFILPVLMFFVIAGCSFACAKRIGASDLGAFFAAFSITLSPFLLTRVFTEWFDTDIYNVIFPLVILTMYVACLDIRAGLRRRLGRALLGGLLVALYAATWQGWWFIFDIIIIASALYLVNLKDVYRFHEEAPEVDVVAQTRMFGAFFIFSAVCVTLLNGPAVFADFILEPVRLSRIFHIAPQSIWPNVYLTVEELGPASVPLVVRSVGGSFIFFMGLIGLLVVFLWERLLRHPVFGCGLLCVAIWIVTSFYAALQALRLALLVIVPAGLAFGLVVGKIRDAVEYLIRRKGLRPGVRRTCRAAFLVLAALYLFAHTTQIYASAYITLPKFNDIWQRTLVRIREATPAESVVDSWWDFGHWFKAVAGRRVLFDGMTQNSPYAYFMARVLLSDDEEAAARTLKMLDAAGHEGVDFLIKKLDGVGEAVRRTQTVLALGPGEGRAELAKVLAPEDVEAAMPLLFPQTAPPAYFIVSYDMLGKVAPISFIGNWDFSKVDMWFKGRQLSQAEFFEYVQRLYNLTPEQALTAHLDVSALNEKEARSWFSQMAAYRSDLRPSETWQGMWMFENGLVVDWSAKRAYVMDLVPDRRGVPASLLYMEDGVLHEELQPEATLDFSALIVRQDGEIKAVLLPPALGKSLLLRLYLLKGEGLKYFRLWNEETDADDNAIYVYELLWPE